MKKLMWLSEVNDAPMELTDIITNQRLTLIYELCDLEGCTVSLEADDGIVETFWLR